MTFVEKTACFVDEMLFLSLFELHLKYWKQQIISVMTTYEEIKQYMDRSDYRRDYEAAYNAQSYQDQERTKNMMSLSKN